MNAFQLSLGDKIELLPRLSDGSYATIPFLSQIQDIVSEREFLIFPPKKDDPDSWLGRVLQLTVVRKDTTYVGTVKIEKKSDEHNLSFFHLVVLGDFKRIQRRAFYRLKLELETELFGWGKFRTVDLSGNGMAIISSRKITEGEIITGTVNLEDDVVEVSGTVVRCLNTSDGENLISIKFKNIRKPMQDKIVKFIYKEQLILLKKGIQPFG